MFSECCAVLLGFLERSAGQRFTVSGKAHVLTMLWWLLWVADLEESKPGLLCFQLLHSIFSTLLCLVCFQEIPPEL